MHRMGLRDNVVRLVGFCALMLPATGTAQSVGGWTAVASLEHGRAGHSVTALTDGRFLIAGGEGTGGLIGQAEVSDLATVQPSGSLVTPRKHHTATRLVDGRVLIVGGEAGPGSGVLAAAEVYDPATGSFSAVGPLNTPRVRHTATLLDSGHVLITGGHDGLAALSSLEMFDPETGSFEAVATGLPALRELHTATLLHDGRVFIAGGRDALGATSSTLYLDPSNWSLAQGPELAEARYGHTATRTTLGDVAVVGGTDGTLIRDTVEMLFGNDPEVELGSAVGILQQARHGHVALTVPDNGHLLIAGGVSATGPAGAAEVLDVASTEVASLGTLALPRAGLALAAARGRVCAFGGTDAQGTPVSLVECAPYRTIATALPDYPPGSPVAFLGTQWMPGETVEIHVQGSRRAEPSVVIAVADDRGAIHSDDFMTVIGDLGTRFFVTAVGRTSGWTAFTTFTDTHRDCGPFVSNRGFCIDSITPDVLSPTSTNEEVTIAALGVASYNRFEARVTSAIQNTAPIVFAASVTGGTLEYDYLGSVFDGDAIRRRFGSGTMAVRVRARLVVRPPIVTLHCHERIGPVCVVLHIHVTPGPETTVSSAEDGPEFFGLAALPAEPPDDTTPPSIEPTISGAVGGEGWFVGDVAVSWDVSDPESPLGAQEGCGATTVSTDTAGLTFTCTATSAGGTASRSVTIKRDTTAPTIVFGAISPPNASGWYRQDVLVPFTVTDDLSGLSGDAPVSPLTLSAEGVGVDADITVSDRAGNVASVASPAVNIDKTAPIISGAPARPPDFNGWYNAPVVVSWTCTDALAGVESCSPAIAYAGPDTAVSAVPGTVTDRAGNTANATVAFAFDDTPPEIVIETPPDGVTYLLNQPVTAVYSCADALSGLGTCAGPRPSGTALDTGMVGPWSFAVATVDQAGNDAARAHTYHVHYGFSGFLAPVANLPLVNQAKAGRTIPVKWALTDHSGVAIADPTSFISLLSSPVACDSSPIVLLEDVAESPGASTLTFEDGQWHYSWQTSSGWNGCQLLQLTLADGTQHYAKFSFR